MPIVPSLESVQKKLDSSCWACPNPIDNFYSTLEQGVGPHCPIWSTWYRSPKEALFKKNSERACIAGMTFFFSYRLQ